MKLNKPSIALAAILAGSPGCAGSQDAPKTPETKSAECDIQEMKNIAIISTEPGRTVFKICNTPYVAQTRSAAASTLKGADAPTKPDVEVKVCNPLDLDNMRVISSTPNKTVRQMCDLIQTSEVSRLTIHSSVSRPVIRAERIPAAPVATKKEEVKAEQYRAPTP